MLKLCRFKDFGHRRRLGRSNPGFFIADSDFQSERKAKNHGFDLPNLRRCPKSLKQRNFNIFGTENPVDVFWYSVSKSSNSVLTEKTDPQNWENLSRIGSKMSSNVLSKRQNCEIIAGFHPGRIVPSSRGSQTANLFGHQEIQPCHFPPQVRVSVATALSDYASLFFGKRTH